MGWLTFCESRRCSRDTYSKSYITENAGVYADKTPKTDFAAVLFGLLSAQGYLAH
jgi:hypothetical protein